MKSGIVGINIGPNKDSSDPIRDMSICQEQVDQLGDYTVINISSPNTPGLRSFHETEKLKGLLHKLASQKKKPLLVKISPDLKDADLYPLLDTIQSYPIDGLIVSNTTVSRDNVKSTSKSIVHVVTGGLSGKPLFDKSTTLLEKIAKYTKGNLTLIASGGVLTAEDAYQKIRKGASLVQIYTAVVYGGPGVVTKLKRELIDLVQRDGFKSIQEAIGIDIIKRP